MRIPGPTTLLLTLLLGAAGCYGSNVGLSDDDDDDDDEPVDDDDDDDDDDATTPDDDDTSPEPAPFEIDEVDPDHGSTAGAFDVDIHYTGSLEQTDEDEIEVRFGSTPAEVIAKTDDRIVVRAPPGCASGEVDLSVETEDDGSDSADFEYEAWAEDLDGAVYGVFKSESPAYPGSEAGAAELGFFEPEVSPPLTHLPPLGTCSYNVVPPDNDRAYYAVGPALSLSAGATVTLTLDPSSDTYVNQSIPAAAVPSGASYSIYGAVDPDGCALDLDSVISAAPALTVSNPDITSTVYADCWYMSGPAPLGPVEWLGPLDSSDYVFITLGHAEVAGAPSVTCHSQDNGAFILQQAHMIGLEPGLHVVSVTRYRVTTSVLSRSGATAYGVFAETQSGFVFVMLTDSACGF